MYNSKIGDKSVDSQARACVFSCDTTCYTTCEGGCEGSCKFGCEGSCEIFNGSTAIDSKIE